MDTRRLARVVSEEEIMGRPAVGVLRALAPAALLAERSLTTAAVSTWPGAGAPLHATPAASPADMAAAEMTELVGAWS